MAGNYTPQDDDFKFPDEVEDKKQGGVVEDDSIEVEIEDDTPEEDRGRTPLPKPLVEELEQDELADYDEKVKVKFKQMRKVWHDERREKEAALREQQEALSFAQRLLEENKRIKGMLQTGEKEYVATAQRAAEMEVASAKAALKAAHEEFDSDKIVEAQQALQEANIKLAQAKAFKLPPLQDVEDPVQDRQPDRQSVPQVDRKLAAWQERNQWFGSNRGMTAYAMGLHQELAESGVQVGSDEYYAALDKTMRKRFPEQFGDDEPRSSTKSKSANVVAPVARSTSPNKIRLTASQVQIARKLGLTPEQYAREQIKLESRNG